MTLLAWAAGQALLRVTGLRWWKLALAALAAIAAVILAEGGPGPALAHHFSGYTSWLRQIGAAQLDYPAPGAFLWPQLPLAIPIGLLAAALNLAGRRQAIDPAEVKRQQREATQRMESAAKRATVVRELGLDVASVPTPTASAYASQLEELQAALVLWRRQEARIGPSSRSRNLLACICPCGRKLRAARTTLEEAPILCGACQAPFEPEEPED